MHYQNQGQAYIKKVFDKILLLSKNTNFYPTGETNIFKYIPILFHIPNDPCYNPIVKYRHMKYIIFHGSFSNPESNWFPELKEKLEILGQQVISPMFPVDDWDSLTKQGEDFFDTIENLESWMNVFEKECIPFIGNDKVCIVAHSLAPLFVLHAIEKFKLTVDSAIFVSPFLEKLQKSWQIDSVNATFYKTDFDFDYLKKHIPISYVLYSNNDPYVDAHFSIEFAQAINSALIQVNGAGHMNSNSNLNEFPLVFELCKTRINLSLYQKYLAHRRELFAIDYVKGQSEEVVYLEPNAVMDEGVFKFRNLQKVGFCTFPFSAKSFWDSQSKYMEEGRKAARRMHNFTRVFILDSYANLSDVILRKQMSLDFDAGIKIYICLATDVFIKLHKIPDFGIWDDEYICFITTDEKGMPIQAKLSSLKNDMEMAKNWRDSILEVATPIKDIKEDINSLSSNQG